MDRRTDGRREPGAGGGGGGMEKGDTREFIPLVLEFLQGAGRRAVSEVTSPQ